MLFRSFLLIGNLARSLSPVIAAIFEFSLIVLMLFFSIIYLVQTKKSISNNELIYYSFLLYLILHLIAASIFRPLELHHSFFDIFYYNLSEFRLSTLGYLLPLIFIPIHHKYKINFENGAVKNDLEIIGESDKNEDIYYTGTEITFLPSTKTFKNKIGRAHV